MSLQEISDATRIQISYLEALERDEFAALPGRAYGKFYIRAYADVLGFDPSPLIGEYDRESAAQDTGPVIATDLDPRRSAWQAAIRQAEDMTDGAVESPVTGAGSAAAGESSRPPAEAPETAAVTGPREPEAAAKPGPGRSLLIVTVLVVALLGVAAWRYWSSPRAVEGVAPAEPARTETTDAVADRPVAPEATAAIADRPAAEERAAPSPSRAEPPAPERAAGSAIAGSDQPGKAEAGASTAGPGLSVAEYGVGDGIENMRLEGRDERFVEGDVAYFQTRVVGGAPGMSIRHVWLREGRPVQSLELAIGSSSWRTHSRKTLWGAGEWTVEARDARGRVLARSTFTVVPRGS